MSTPHARAAQTKKQRTHDKAVKAVDKLLRKAKDATPLPRMEEIADAADVGVATLYKTFGSRDELLVQAFKTIILDPLDEEVENIEVVADLQPVQRLTFYFSALTKMHGGGRWRLFQAANHSRLDWPWKSGSDPVDDDELINTFVGHIARLGPKMNRDLMSVRYMVALFIFDFMSRGAYISDADRAASDLVDLVEALELQKDLRAGKLMRVK